MGIAGLMTGAGAAEGLQQLIKNRLLEREMLLREQAQQSQDARAQSQDQWQRMHYDQADRSAAAASQERAIDNERANTQQRIGMFQSWAKDAPESEGVPNEFSDLPSVSGRIKAIPLMGMDAETGAPTPPLRFMGPQPPKESTDNTLHKMADGTLQPTVKATGGKFYEAPRGSGEMSSLTPGGLDVAATQYAQTGSMPPLGMGSAGMRSAIINRAAELFPDLNIAATAGDYRANLGSMTQLTKRYNAMQAYANQAKMSLDNARALSVNVPRTGVPLVNKYKNWANKTLRGSAPLSEFEVFVYTAARDYARVTSGGSESVAQMTDAANSAADALLNSAMTPEAFESALGAMQRDMDNATGTLKDQIQVVRGDVGRKPGAAPPSDASGSKVITKAQVDAVAKKNGTTYEVEAARAAAEGFVIR